MQALARTAERRIGGLRLAGGEAVECRQGRRVLAGRGRTVTLGLLRKAGATRRTAQTQHFPLDNHGAADVGFSRASAHVTYRFVVRFAGDTYGKPSSATSTTVVIG